MVYASLYRFLVFLTQVCALFSRKLKRFLEERNHYRSLEASFVRKKDQRLFWFHAASMGEFEQIKPLLKEIQKTFPKTQIGITFFSSSGFSQFKNTSLADVVTYLPLDRKKDLNTFLEWLRPDALFLVKYEFWPNLIRTGKEKKLPIMVISARFRKNQLFFQPFSLGMKKILNKIDFFFVVNKQSQQLLQTLGIKNVEVVGDTRADQVHRRAEKAETHPLVSQFLQHHNCIVAGSTWAEDHEIIVPEINKNKNYKWIIAPHKIDEQTLATVIKKIKVPIAKRTTFNASTDLNKKVLLLDTIGELAQIYHHADLAYVGGAAGKTGLHNILEPAAYGCPIVIGNNYQHFPEAVDLVNLGGVVPVKDQNAFSSVLKTAFANQENRKEKGKINRDFIKINQGSTKKIISHLKMRYKLV